MEAAADNNNELSTNIIVKGKRTKRQRVQSPIPNFPHTSSFDEGDFYDSVKNNNPSPTSSQEEEDMANCLILLAQGQFRDSSTTNIAMAPVGGGANGSKFNSRRFLETGSAGTGKAGYYVYECKTCCRTFPSFQALGGHRASHKKPKGIQNYDEKKQLMVSSDEELDGHYKDISSLSLQLSNNIHDNISNNNRNKAKVHECSICGAEFTSGQALGGHMRRHRAPTAAAPASGSHANLSTLTSMAMESEEAKKGRNLISLDLDLNLPAPDDEKIPFASKQNQQDQQQKSPLVFSSPTLVDCHY